jgi:ERCC4-related helicase
MKRFQSIFPELRVGWVRVKLPPEYEMIRNEIKGMIESVISRLRESGLSQDAYRGC